MIRAGIRLTPLDDPNGTARNVDLIDDEGYRLQLRVTASSPGLPVRPADARLLVAGAAAVVTELVDYAAPVVEQAAAAGIPVWLDAGPWDGEDDSADTFLPLVRCLAVSDENIENPLGVARRLTRGGIECVVVTHGSRGATVFVHGAAPVFVPIGEGRVLDGSGARQAFTAGVVFGRCVGWDWPTSLRAGGRCASRCVATLGPTDPTLSASDLDAPN